MAITNERMAAIEQMLANRGRGIPGENDGYFDTIVRPVLSAPDTQRAMDTTHAYAQRNQIVADAAKQMIGGYGSALNSARQQIESEWMRRYLEGLKPSGKGPSGGGGGKKDDEPTTMVTDTPAADPWAWVNDYVASNAPSASPGVAGGGRQPYSSRAGSVAASGIGRPQPKPKPQPRALPKVVNY